MTLALELLLERQEIFHDAVVDDDDIAGAVAMRVGILLSGRPCVAQRVWPMP